MCEEPDGLAPTVHPLLHQNVTAEPLLFREEEMARAARERLTRLHQVCQSLPARRHGQDPGVRDTEVLPVKALPPRFLVGEELATKGGRPESLPRDRHRAAVGFEEEEGAIPTFRFARELETEDSIRLHT